MQYRDLKRRERKVIVGGITVAATVIVVAYGGIPYYRAWSNREAEISAAQSELSRVRALIAEREKLSQHVVSLDRTSHLSGKLVSARTAALAASEVQRVIRAYADRTKVTVDRLEFGASPDLSATGGTTISLSISAVGDIYGITDFLAAVRSGPPVLELSEMTLVANSALRDGLMQFSGTIRAPVVIE